MSKSDKEKKREHAYELMEQRRVIRRKSDPLEEALESEDEELAREAKRKRLEAIVLERELKKKKLESELEGTEKKEKVEKAPMTSGNLVTNLIRGGVDPKVANEWLRSLSPEALGALIALQSDNPMLAMLAFGMNSQKKGEGLTVKDVLELNKATQKAGSDIKIDVAELIKAASGVGKPSQTVNPKEIIDGTLQAIQTGMQLAGGGQSEREQSWFNKLMSTPDGIKTAKELFGGNPDYLRLQKEIREADRKFMKEMKESDRRWQAQLMRMRDESRRMWAEAQERKRRTELASSALKRIGAAVARAVAEEEEGAEAKPASKKRKGKVRELDCPECGAPISIPPNTKVGGKVTCAQCESEFEVTE